MGKKKVASKLIDLDGKLYAVLAVGEGYFKDDHGYLSFNDNLPRASGTYHSWGDASAARDKIIAMATIELAKQQKEYDYYSTRKDNPYTGTFFLDKAKSILLAAQTSMIVEVTIREATRV